MKLWLSSAAKNKLAAFSLLELLIVLAILGILVKLGLPSYRRFLYRSDCKVVKGNLYSLASKLEAFYLTSRSYRAASVTKWLNKLPKNKYYIITYKLKDNTYELVATPQEATLKQQLILRNLGEKTCSDQTQQCWEECK